MPRSRHRDDPLSLALAAAAGALLLYLGVADASLRQWSALAYLVPGLLLLGAGVAGLARALRRRSGRRE